MSVEMTDKPEAQEGNVRWWHAPCVSENEKLSAQNAASTLFRFFRSRHVADLRIIFWLASVLLAIDFLIALTLALATPIAHLLHHPWHINLNNVGWFLARGVEVLLTQIPHTIVLYFGPAIPVCGAVMAWAYLSASKRLGVVDLFACEIKTLCRVGTILNFGQTIVDKSKIEEQRFPAAESEEDYFPIFSNNSGDLEQLEATVVGNITEFYTYMKVVRDTFRRFGASEKVARIEVLNLVYMLYLAYESGRKAIRILVEFEPTRAENIMTILLTELPCYARLCEHFRDDQLRFTRLMLRLEDYETEVGAITSDVNAPHEGEKKKDWAAATHTLPTIKECYAKIKSEVGKIKSEVEAAEREKSSAQSTQLLAKTA